MVIIGRSFVLNVEMGRVENGYGMAVMKTIVFWLSMTTFIQLG